MTEENYTLDYEDSENYFDSLTIDSGFDLMNELDYDSFGEISFDAATSIEEDRNNLIKKEFDYDSNEVERIVIKGSFSRNG